MLSDPPDPPDPQPQPQPGQDPQGEFEPAGPGDPLGTEPGPELELLEPSDPHPQPEPSLELQLHASAQDEKRHAKARTIRRSFFCERERAIIFILFNYVLCFIIEESDL